MKLTEARATLAAAVRVATASNVNVYDHLPDQLAVPAVLVGWASPWWSVETVCMDREVTAEVVVVAGRVDYGPQLGVLEQIADAVYHALADDPEWTAPDAYIGPYALDVAGVTYLAATLTTTAIVTT